MRAEGHPSGADETAMGGRASAATAPGPAMDAPFLNQPAETAADPLKDNDDDDPA